MWEGGGAKKPNITGEEEGQQTEDNSGMYVAL